MITPTPPPELPEPVTGLITWWYGCVMGVAVLNI